MSQRSLASAAAAPVSASRASAVAAGAASALIASASQHFEEATPQELDDCYAFEKWAHWLLSQSYTEADLDQNNVRDQQYLGMYLAKAKRLEEQYLTYGGNMNYASSSSSAEIVRDLALELAQIEQEELFIGEAQAVVSGIRQRRNIADVDDADDDTENDALTDTAEKGDVIPLLDTAETDRKELVNRKIDELRWPFNQVSRGVMLGYVLEVLAGVRKDTYVSQLRTEISYQIQMVSNLKILLQILRQEHHLDVESQGISAEGLTSSVADINKFFWLLFSHFRVSQVQWQAQGRAFKGVSAILEWVRSCITLYPLYDSAQALSMETSFENGVYFCYVIHYYCPESIRLDRVNKLATQENFRQAMESSWRRFNIPHVIQQGSVGANYKTITLFLSMLFEKLSSKNRINFDTQQIAGIIGRKVNFEKIKADYMDRADQLLKTVRVMEPLVKKLDKERFLPRSDISRLEAQIELFTQSKKRAYRLLKELQLMDLQLRAIPNATNKLPPFDPPSQVSLQNLQNMISDLTQQQMGYSLAICSLYATSDVYTKLCKQFGADAEAIRTWASSMFNQITSMDITTASASGLESMQEYHEDIVEYLIDAGKRKAQFEKLTQINNELLNKHVVFNPHSQYEYKQILEIWNKLSIMMSEKQTELDSAMARCLDLETLKVEHSVAATDLATAIAGEMVALDSVALGSDAMKNVMEEIEAGLAMKRQKIAELQAMEKRIEAYVGANKSSLVLNDSMILAKDIIAFLEELKEYKIQKSSVQQGLQSRFQELNGVVSMSKLVEGILSKATLTMQTAATLISRQQDILTAKQSVAQVQKDLKDNENLLSEFCSTAPGVVADVSASQPPAAVAQVRRVDVSSAQQRWRYLQQAANALADIIQKSIEESQQSKKATLSIGTDAIARVTRIADALALLDKEGPSALPKLQQTFANCSADSIGVIKALSAVAQAGLLNASEAPEGISNVEALLTQYLQLFEKILGIEEYGRKQEVVTQDNVAKRFEELKDELSAFLQNFAGQVAQQRTLDDLSLLLEQHASLWPKVQELQFIARLTNTEDPSIADIATRYDACEAGFLEQLKLVLQRGDLVVHPRFEGIIGNLASKVQKLLQKSNDLMATFDQQLQQQGELVEDMPSSSFDMMRQLAELRADLHHCSTFYQYMSESLALLGDSSAQLMRQIKSIGSNMSFVKANVDRLVQMVQQALTKTVKTDEFRRAYRQLAGRFLDVIDNIRTQLTIPFDTSSVTEEEIQHMESDMSMVNTRIEELDKSRQQIQQLMDDARATFGTGVELQISSYGEYSIDFISSQFEHVKQLARRLNLVIEAEKNKLRSLRRMQTWVTDQLQTVDAWLNNVEVTTASCSNLRSLDELLFIRRRLEHHMQELDFMHRIVSDISQLPDATNSLTDEGQILLSEIGRKWSKTGPKIQQALKILEAVERHVQSRLQLVSQLQLKIHQFQWALEMLESKKVERSKIFYGITPIPLLQSYMEDCDALRLYVKQLDDASRHTQLVLDASQLSPAMAQSIQNIPVIKQLGEQVQSLTEDLEKHRVVFTKFFSITIAKIEKLQRSERELQNAHSTYGQYAKGFLSSVLRELDQFEFDANQRASLSQSITNLSSSHLSTFTSQFISSRDMARTHQANLVKKIEAMQPMFSNLQSIHLKQGSTITETVPFDIIALKWQQLAQATKKDVTSQWASESIVDSGSREKELKQQILHLAQGVASWAENALKLDSLVSSLVDISATQNVMGLLYQIQEEEGVQYSKLIQAVSLHTELSLIVSALQANGRSAQSAHIPMDDLDNIIAFAEDRWNMWLSESHSIVKRLEEKLEELCLDEERREQVVRIAQDTLSWIQDCSQRVKLIATGEISTKIKLEIEVSKLDYWVRQVSVREQNLKLMRRMFDALPLPGERTATIVSQTEQQWRTMENLISGKQKQISQLHDWILQQRDEQIELCSREEQAVTWIGRARAALVSSLRTESVEDIASTLDEISERLQEELEPIMQQLRGDKSFTHLQHLENHLSSLLFLYDRTKQRYDELSAQEQRKREKLSIFEQSVSENISDMRQLIVQYSDMASWKPQRMEQASLTSTGHTTAQAQPLEVSSLNLSSMTDKSALITATLEEMSARMDGMVEIYQEMAQVVANYATRARELDETQGDVNSRDSSAAEEFEQLSIQAFEQFEATYLRYMEEYDRCAKSDAVSKAYFSSFGLLQHWEQQQRQLLTNILEQRPSIQNTSSSMQVFRDYFSQRPHVNHLYQQIATIWSRLSSLGVVLSSSIKTPLDLHASLEQLDKQMNKHMSKWEAMLDQFGKTLGGRREWFEHASEMCSWLRAELLAHASAAHPNESASSQSLVSELQQLETTKQGGQNSQSIMHFLDEQRRAMTEQSPLTLDLADDTVGSIFEALREDYKLFKSLNSNKERLINHRFELAAETNTAKDNFGRMLGGLHAYLQQTVTKIQQWIGNMNEAEDQPNVDRYQRVMRNRKTTLRQLIVEHNRRTPELQALLAIYDKLQQSNTSEQDLAQYSGHIAVPDVASRWKQVTKALDDVSTRLRIEETRLPPEIRSIDDVQRYLDTLFLLVWVNDSRADVEELLQHGLPQDDFQEVLFFTNIFQRETLANTRILGTVSDQEANTEPAQQKSSSRRSSVDSSFSIIAELNQSFGGIRELSQNLAQMLYTQVSNSLKHRAAAQKHLSIFEAIAEFITKAETLVDEIDPSASKNAPAALAEVIKLQDFFCNSLLRQIIEDQTGQQEGAFGPEDLAGLKRRADRLRGHKALLRVEQISSFVQGSDIHDFGAKLLNSLRNGIEQISQLCSLNASLARGTSDAKQSAEIKEGLRELLQVHAELTDELENMKDISNNWQTHMKEIYTCSYDVLSVVGALYAFAQQFCGLCLQMIDAQEQKRERNKDAKAQYLADEDRLLSNVRHLKDLWIQMMAGYDIGAEVKANEAETSFVEEDGNAVSSNTTDGPLPQSTIGATFVKKMKSSAFLGGSMDSVASNNNSQHVQLMLLQRVVELLPELSALHQRLCTLIQTGAFSQIESKFSQIYAEWDDLCSKLETSTKDQLQNAAGRGVLLRCSVQQLRSWFEEASDFLLTFEQGTSYYEMQSSLLQIRQFLARFRFFEEKYREVTKQLAERNESKTLQFLQQLREGVTGKMRQMLSIDDLMDITLAHQHHERLQVSFASKAEELVTWLALADEEISGQLRPQLEQLRTALTSMDAYSKSGKSSVSAFVQQQLVSAQALQMDVALLQQRMQSDWRKKSAQLLQEQFDAILNQQIHIHQLDEDNVEEPHEVQPIFTMLTLHDVQQRLAQVEENARTLQEEISEIFNKDMLNGHLNRGLSLVSDINSLVAWVDKNTFLLLPQFLQIDNKDTMVFLQKEYSRWNSEREGKRMLQFDKINEQLLVIKESIQQNNAPCPPEMLWKRFAMEKFGTLLPLKTADAEIRIMWQRMSEAAPSRATQLQLFERSVKDTEKQFGTDIPKEIIDTIQNTFVHFALITSPTLGSSSTQVLQKRENLANFLRSLSICSVKLEQFEALVNKLMPSLDGKVDFGTVMKTFSGDQSIVRSIALQTEQRDALKAVAAGAIVGTNDPAVRASMLNTNAIATNFTWDKLQKVFGAAFTESQIKMLYTLVRFTARGVDMAHLSDLGFS